MLQAIKSKQKLQKRKNSGGHNITPYRYGYYGNTWTMTSEFGAKNGEEGGKSQTATNQSSRSDVKTLQQERFLH